MKEIRSCIICRKKRNKHEFIRIVSDTTGTLIVDEKFNMSARGIYICNEKQCKERLLNLKDIKRVTKANIVQQELKDIILKLGEN